MQSPHPKLNIVERQRSSTGVITWVRVGKAPIRTAAGAPVQPLRFRGNLYVSGWPAWHEFELLGTEIAIGGRARLKVIKRIQRCAATRPRCSFRSPGEEHRPGQVEGRKRVTDARGRQETS